jgi:heptosyltransferase-2
MKKNRTIEKILIINLSNIGDVVLTLPAVDLIKGNFPEAKLTMLVGPKAKGLFELDSRIDDLIIYDKYKSIKSKISLSMHLRRYNFDMVLDFRHTAFPLFLNAPYKSPVVTRTRSNLHKKEVYLELTKNVFPFNEERKLSPRIFIDSKDENYIDELLKQNNISSSKKLVVVAPGAASNIKRWTKNGFAEVCDWLISMHEAQVVFVGDEKDLGMVEAVKIRMKRSAVDLTGKTSLRQLVALLARCDLLISNDSAVMHMGSYLDVPVLAIFGPTDPKRYGPWNYKSRIMRREIVCSPCRKAQCRYAHECMRSLNSEVATRVAEDLLFARDSQDSRDIDFYYKRILIIRTDRIGDVVLSTPVFKAVRDRYPNAHIAVMVRPYVKDIVEGNPYVDELIIYDKYGVHKSVWGSFRFARNLKNKQFDLAIILHPTNRVNIISFIAGIPKRVGYNKKCGFFLTDKLEHSKQLGEKHEADYSLDVLRVLGIQTSDKSLFMPLKQESEYYIEEIFKMNKLSAGDRLVAFHPGASCPSKRWPVERFAQVANLLIEKYSIKPIIVSSREEINLANAVAKDIRSPTVNLAGKTSISQLASLLKRCKLFISNDSGPVHVCSAVGTPVIVIFGRNQAGLSPIRWGPLGKNDRVVHKEVGCRECLAHNCKKGFLCLKAVTPDDVIEEVDELSKLW